MKTFKALPFKLGYIQKDHCCCIRLGDLDGDGDKDTIKRVKYEIATNQK